MKHRSGPEHHGLRARAPVAPPGDAAPGKLTEAVKADGAITKKTAIDTEVAGVVKRHDRRNLLSLQNPDHRRRQREPRVMDVGNIRFPLLDDARQFPGPAGVPRCCAKSTDSFDPGGIRRLEGVDFVPLRGKDRCVIFDDFVFATRLPVTIMYLQDFQGGKGV